MAFDWTSFNQGIQRTAAGLTGYFQEQASQKEEEKRKIKAEERAQKKAIELSDLQQFHELETNQAQTDSQLRVGKALESVRNEYETNRIKLQAQITKDQQDRLSRVKYWWDSPDVADMMETSKTSQNPADKINALALEAIRRKHMNWQPMDANDIKVLQQMPMPMQEAVMRGNQEVTKQVKDWEVEKQRNDAYASYRMAGFQQRETTIKQSAMEFDIRQKELEDNKDLSASELSARAARERKDISIRLASFGNEYRALLKKYKTEADIPESQAVIVDQFHTLYDMDRRLQETQALADKRLKEKAEEEAKISPKTKSVLGFSIETRSANAKIASEPTAEELKALHEAYIKKYKEDTTDEELIRQWKIYHKIK
jgi:hypothetical protein